ncbi:MAG: helical backbone metal receptor [Candidatus Cloacimonetes bacterium]|nr:helical backbone metal receptor [Candidatus Cloacimonadota bacterium]
MKFFYLKIYQLLIYITVAVSLFSCMKQSSNNSTPRYIVLSPEIAEVLVAIGVSQEIVGITEECKTSADAQIVGSFGQVNLEKIAQLRPSIVFTSALEQDIITEKLNKLQIKTVQFYPKNTSDLLSMIEELGEVCGKQAEATALINSLQQAFAEFQTIAENRQNNPKVFIEIYGNPIMTADNSAYLGDLLTLAGGINIFPALARDYCRVNAEDVVFQNPDIILLTYPGVTTEDIKQRKGWAEVNAVQHSRIYTIDELDPDLILRAGPRNIEGIAKMVALFYE